MPTPPNHPAPDPTPPRGHAVARWALSLTVFLVMLGGYTRGSGSGYGCEDRWPLCEDGLLGGLLPRLEYHMIVEWTHRWVAAIVGLLIIATAVVVWRARPRNPRAVWPAVAAIGVVGIQGWLGRAIVKGDLDRDLVSLHLGVSMVIVGLLVLVTVATGTRRTTRGPAAWRWTAVVAAVGAYGVLILGTTVHNLYFPGWPIPTTGVLPDFSSRFVALHYFHRLFAGLAFGYVAILAYRAWRAHRPERVLLAAAAGAFTVNVALGAVHVFTKVTSAGVVAVHLLFSTLAWATAVAAAAVAWGWNREET